MMPHEDMSQDKDMIKAVLQKIIDEMDTMESDRIMPEGRKPKAVEMEVKTMHPMDEEMESDELDPSVLSELMSKAGEADETGALPEDRESDLPPEIRDAVNRKKEQGLYAGSDGVRKPTGNRTETIDEAEPENQRNQHPKLTSAERSTTKNHREGNDSASQSTSDFLGMTPEDLDAARNKKR